MRRASSPVTSAALLVVGVAIGAGLIFGTLFAAGSLSPRTVTQTTTVTVTNTTSEIFGSFTSSAQVSVLSVNLNHVIWTAGACTGAPLCTVIVANTGNSNVNANGIAMSYGGTTCMPVDAAFPLLIPGTGAQTALTLSGLGTCAAAVAGQAFSGSVQLSDGAQVAFSGTFS